MTYAYIADSVIHAVGRLPQSARRLDTQEWVLGLADATVALQEACGWYAVADTTRPDDTPTTTHTRTVELVAGVPTVVWTERPLTDDEQFARQQAQAPDVTVAIAARLNPAEPALWVQPTGAHDAYLPAAIVLDPAGDRWRNDLGTVNVWPLDNPHARWTNLDATVPDGPQPWIAPTGSHDAYPAGAQVTHNGRTWQSDLDGNVWEPGVYGWTDIGPA